MDRKYNKIRKNFTLDYGICKNLEALSEKTHYSQSELIEIALSKLDESMEKNPNAELSAIAKKLKMGEDKIISLVLRKVSKGS